MPSENELRIDLAAAFRWTARLGMHEAIANHFTLAVTSDGSEFLINPWGRHFSEMRSSDLLRVNIDGTVLSGEGIVERPRLGPPLGPPCPAGVIGVEAPAIP